MPDQEKTEFIPFNAINEFMRSDFRAAVLQDVFLNLLGLADADRKNLERIFRKLVMIPGFRNSSMAPAGLKARSAAQAFEKKADFTGLVIQTWSRLHPNLARNVHALLASREWTMLPVDADRVKLPGFLTAWPPGETFDSINNQYRQMFPEDQYHSDDVCLMAVWVSGRLPVNTEPYGQDTYEEINV